MIQPGKSITQAYKLTNNSDFDLYLTAKMVPFSPADHYGNITLSTSPSVYPNFQHESVFSLQNSDIGLNQSFKLSAGKSQQLVLKISMPEGSPEKDYYYTLLIEQAERGEHISQAGSSHRIKIGANLLITVSESGQPKIDFQVAEFKAQPKFADLFDTVKFKLLIQNTGQAFFKPNGKIEIYNTLFNKKMAELDLLPENVLIDSAREIRCGRHSEVETSAEESPSEEEIQPTPCQFSSWLPGPYKAVIAGDAVNDQSNIVGNADLRSLPTMTTFYLIPYRLILALLVIILIIWQIKQKQLLDNN